jgi:hypothetical protein
MQDLPADEEGRVTTAQAAQFLSTSVQNVVGRFRSGAIRGHQPAGEGGTIYLDAASVRAYGVRPGRRRGPAPTRGVSELTTALARIEARLHALEKAITEGTQGTTDSQTAAVLGLLAVSEEQRAAGSNSDETSGHLARAVLSALESKKALNRADELRDEVVRQFSLPKFPPRR